MSSGLLPRRSFLLSAGGAIGALWLGIDTSVLAQAGHHVQSLSDAEIPHALQFFNAADAADVEAIGACIIPSGATPGAREARCVIFTDHALQTFFSDRAAAFRPGLAEFQKAVADRHAGSAFAALAEPDQIAFLESVEQTPFFGGMIFMTVLGFLSSPKYGGNAAGLGWKAIGFEDQHIFMPPFGYYDRDYPGFQPYPGTAAAK